MQNAKNIYRTFVEFEEDAANVYLSLASHFSPENPELAAFWLDMAMQEKQHAGLLQFCLAEELFAERLPAEVEVRRARDLFADLKKRARDPHLQIDAAFRIAMELETSEVNAIYSHLTTPLHGSLYLMRRKIASSLPDHAAVIEREARKYGIELHEVAAGRH